MAMTRLVVVGAALLASVGAFSPQPRRLSHRQFLALRAEPAPGAPEPALPAELTAEYACYADAEDAAIALIRRSDHENAITLLKRALTLPGSARDIVRQRMAASSPVGGSTSVSGLDEIFFASRNEKQCAFYNIACCEAALGRRAAALDSLTDAFELGFEG